MTHATFIDLLHTKYPHADAWMHGKFGGTEKNMKVNITFEPNGKCYAFYGSYQKILSKVGIPVAYQSEIDYAKRELDRCKSEHGVQDEFFGIEQDYSDKISRLETFIDSVNNGKYIIVKG